MTALANEDYAYLREVVYQNSRNLLQPSHDHLFQTRLNDLLRRQGLKHLRDLVHLLRTARDPWLERALAEAMTINETSFFRGCKSFDVLRTEVLPGLIEARRATRRLRLWSAASSTGQEAYSLAILLREYFPLQSQWDIQIEGTDISGEVVRRARLGKYQRIEMNRGLPARFLVRYFDHFDEDWVVKPEIARVCNFRQANLCAPLPFQDSFDVILMRNVMLYFSLDTRRSVLAAMHRLLASDGCLFLGAAEQPPDRSQWETVFSGGTSYVRPR